jgi:hypothetical protein
MGRKNTGNIVSNLLLVVTLTQAENVLIACISALFFIGFGRVQSNKL